MIEKKTAGSLVFNIIITFLMLIFFVVMIYPFLYILLYSISDISKLKTPLLIYPVGMHFKSYVTIFRNPSYIRAAVVTIARCLVGPFGMLIVSGMGAYAISRQDLVFGKGIRMYLLFSMYISAGLIPGYMLIKYLGLMSSFWVYIIPGLASIFNMILIKAYISSLPRELEEAVLIDGGSDLDAYFRIILPLTLPINAAVILFSVIAHWNSYIDVALYNATNPALFTLAFRLFINLSALTNLTLDEIKRMQESGTIVNLNAKSLNMAMTVVTIVPIMCIYPILQKYFASGLLIGAIKM